MHVCACACVCIHNQTVTSLPKSKRNCTGAAVWYSLLAAVVPVKLTAFMSWLVMATRVLTLFHKTLLVSVPHSGWQVSSSASFRLKMEAETLQTQFLCCEVFWCCCCCYLLLSLPGPALLLSCCTSCKRDSTDKQPVGMRETSECWNPQVHAGSRQIQTERGTDSSEKHSMKRLLCPWFPLCGTPTLLHLPPPPPPLAAPPLPRYQTAPRQSRKERKAQKCCFLNIFLWIRNTGYLLFTICRNVYSMLAG